MAIFDFGTEYNVHASLNGCLSIRRDKDKKEAINKAIHGVIEANREHGNGKY